MSSPSPSPSPISPSSPSSSPFPHSDLALLTDHFRLNHSHLLRSRYRYLVMFSCVFCYFLSSSLFLLFSLPLCPHWLSLLALAVAASWLVFTIKNGRFQLYNNGPGDYLRSINKYLAVYYMKYDAKTGELVEVQGPLMEDEGEAGGMAAGGENSDNGSTGAACVDSLRTSISSTPSPVLTPLKRSRKPFAPINSKARQDTEKELDITLEETDDRQSSQPEQTSAPDASVAVSPSVFPASACAAPAKHEKEEEKRLNDPSESISSTSSVSPVILSPSSSSS